MEFLKDRHTVVPVGETLSKSSPPGWLRWVLLGAAFALLTFGLLSGTGQLEVAANTARNRFSDPPTDATWLWCAGGGYLLLLAYFWLSAPQHLRQPSPSQIDHQASDTDDTLLKIPNRHFHYSIYQFAGFFFASLIVLSAHLLRQQLIMQVPYQNAQTLVTLQKTQEDVLVRDPRVVPTLLSTRRGAIYAGERLIAFSEPLTTSLRMRRVYPEPNISYLAGYFDPLRYGTTGLEASFDRFLTGTEGSDPVGDEMRELLHQPLIGKDLHLTIDPDLQDLAQDALQGRKGALVLLDVHSGAILALASYPHVDPQQMMVDPYAQDPEAEEQRVLDYVSQLNSSEDSPFIIRAVQGMYPPGSTYKTVTAAAALDTGQAEIDTIFNDTDGVIQVKPDGMAHRDCPDCRPPDHGFDYTLTEGFQYSLNVVFAELGVQLGMARMEEYAHRFGVGTGYSIGLPVGAGRLADDRITLADPDSLAGAAYGQGQMLATPLEMAVMAATICNDGRVPAPYLVDRVTEQGTNKVTWRFEPHDLNPSPAISPRTASLMRQMMVTAVEEGWVTDARISGYVVGGKTGTAEVENGLPHSWFIGWGGKDVDHPLYAVAAVIENGGEGSAAGLPAARVVLEAALVAGDQQR